MRSSWVLPLFSPRCYHDNVMAPKNISNKNKFLEETSTEPEK